MLYCPNLSHLYPNVTWFIWFPVSRVQMNPDVTCSTKMHRMSGLVLWLHWVVLREQQPGGGPWTQEAGHWQLAPLALQVLGRYWLLRIIWRIWIQGFRICFNDVAFDAMPWNTYVAWWAHFWIAARKLAWEALGSWTKTKTNPNNCKERQFPLGNKAPTNRYLYSARSCDPTGAKGVDPVWILPPDVDHGPRSVVQERLQSRQSLSAIRPICGTIQFLSIAMDSFHSAQVSAHASSYSSCICEWECYPSLFLSFFLSFFLTSFFLSLSLSVSLSLSLSLGFWPALSNCYPILVAKARKWHLEIHQPEVSSHRCPNAES